MPPKRKAAVSKEERELNSLTLDELRRELEGIGEDVGPIDSSNKDLYVRLLARKKKLKIETGGSTVSTSTSSSTVSSDFIAAASPSLAHYQSPAAFKLGRQPLKNDSPSGPVSPGFRHVPVAASILKEPATSPKKSRAVSAGSAKKGVRSKGTSKPTRQTIDDFKIEGLTAATFTPMKENGELNLPVIGPYADWLLSTGVTNIFLNGTTGESMSLTVEERKQLTSEWISVAAKRFKVIVHVGTENLKYTCELARHAQELGADGIGVMPTTFFKPASINHLVLYLQRVAEAAPSLPMYYYHIPSMTGVNLPMEDFLEVASARLPTLRGLKYTHHDLMEFGRCVVSQGSKYQIIFGKDEQVISALALGGTAAIGSTYNYAGKLFNRLFSAYQRRDTEAAKLEQRRAQAMIKLLFKYGPHAGGGKAFMKLVGVDCGPPRLPVLPLSPESIKSLKCDLSDIGFFEWS